MGNSPPRRAISVYAKPGPSAAQIQEKLAEAKRQADAERAKQQQRMEEQQRKQRLAAERAVQLRQREEALRAQEAQRRRAREKAEQDLAEAKKHEEEARKCLPKFLQKDHGSMVNVAVVGGTGIGKSLFINAVRGVRPTDTGWAAVGVTETTTTPKPFPFPNEDCAQLWDIPGAGTEAFPSQDYIQSFGLRHFDVVIIMSATRFTETDVVLLQELQKSGKPFFLVRTKIDIDIANNESDNGFAPEVTKQSIRNDLEVGSGVNPYLISSRQMLSHDFDKLMRDLRAACRSAAVGKGLEK